MKKPIMLILVLSFLINVNSYASKSPLLDMRSRFLEDSNSIKLLLKNSKDVILLSTLWDSCFMTMTQLDAYFSMVGIFESVKKGNITDATVGYLLSWLEDIKKTSVMNISSLNSAAGVVEAATKIVVEGMKGNFSDLNKVVDVEINKLLKLREGLKTKQAR
ncbi:MAG: hypothetical protein NT066_02495 [Candidatus Omnitrophica bacterium]|nr:hypothetical protein [Candidatus Omnitrophota bacterium]